MIPIKKGVVGAGDDRILAFCPAVGAARVNRIKETTSEHIQNYLLKHHHLCQRMWRMIQWFDKIGNPQAGRRKCRQILRGCVH